MSNEEKSRAFALPLKIEIWSLDLHWDLGFEHWDFRPRDFRPRDLEIELSTYTLPSLQPAVKVR